MSDRHDTDIRICWRNQPFPEGVVEIDLLGALVSGNDLVTAIIVSLFTDRLAEASDPLPLGRPGEAPDRRGWYGDTWLAQQNAGDRIGSRLWLLPGTVSSDKTPLIAKGYAAEALQWLVDDEVVSRVDCDAFFINNRRDRLGITVDLYRPGLTDPSRLRFDWAWRNFNPCDDSGLAGNAQILLTTDDDLFLTGDDGTLLTP